MSLITFRPPVAPSPGTGYAPQLKILAAEFGDGYSQPTPDGINHIKDQVSLRWDSLSMEQMHQIHDFFMRQQGTRAFYYTGWGQRGATKWTCKEFAPKQGEDGVWTYQATLVQSFTNER